MFSWSPQFQTCTLATRKVFIIFMLVALMTSINHIKQQQQPRANLAPCMDAMSLKDPWQLCQLL